MSKLTRATVPMCPECGAELRVSKWPDDRGSYVCGACHTSTDPNPPMGYYPADVAGAVARLRDIRDGIEQAEDGPTVWSYELHTLADELEGKQDE
jgi:transcription elongation factor Elf1